MEMKVFGEREPKFDIKAFINKPTNITVIIVIYDSGKQKLFSARKMETTLLHFLDSLYWLIMVIPS